MNNKIHIVLASDANYLPGLEVTKATMLAACSAPDRLVTHIFDGTDLANLSVFRNSEPSTLPLWNGSLMPYLRLFLPDLLPEVDWVVYSDVDTVWLRDVCELWDMTAGSRCGCNSPSIYWVKDFEASARMSLPWFRQAGATHFDIHRYACAGICVMNLQKMRQSGFCERALEIIRKVGVGPFPDQDMLNLLCQNDGILLPDCWDIGGHWQNGQDWDHTVGSDGKAVYHIFGVGRHFHDETPVDYPSPYDFWNRAAGRRSWEVPMRWQYRLMAACWWASGLVRLLPGEMLRCRVYRQWLFARVIRVIQRTRKS